MPLYMFMVGNAEEANRYKQFFDDSFEIIEPVGC